MNMFKTMVLFLLCCYMYSSNGQPATLEKDVVFKSCVKRAVVEVHEISAAVSNLKDEFPRTVSSDMNNLKDDMKDYMLSIVNSLKDEIKSDVSNLRGEIKTETLLVVSKLKDEIKNVNETMKRDMSNHNVEMLMAVTQLNDEIGIIKSEVSNFRGEISTVLSNLKDEFPRAVLSDMNNLKDDMKDYMLSMVNSLKDEIKSDVSNLRGEIKTDTLLVVSKLKEEIKNLNETMKSEISNLKVEMLGQLKDEINTSNVIRQVESKVNKHSNETLVTHKEILKSIYLINKYTIHSEKKSWEDAKSYCLTRQRNLVSINSEEEWEDIVKLIKANNPAGCALFWTSGHKDTDGNWITAQGVPVISSLWSTGQPDNYRSKQDCAVLKINYNYKQDDVQCTNRLCFICEI